MHGQSTGAGTTGRDAGAEDGCLAHAAIEPGKSILDKDRLIELPSPSTRLDQLRHGHLARRFFKARGYDPDTLGRCYKLRYCAESDDPVARQRIIIPIEERGEMRGWQSLAIRDAETREPALLSASGMKQSRLVYNLDTAKKYATSVLVRWPTDVWTFGPMALCPVGNKVSEQQIDRLRTVVSTRQLVVLLEHYDPGYRFNEPLEHGFPFHLRGQIAFVRPPRDLPPGRKGRSQLRAHVVAEAAKQGLSVTFRKKS